VRPDTDSAAADDNNDDDDYEEVDYDAGCPQRVAESGN